MTPDQLFDPSVTDTRKPWQGGPPAPAVFGSDTSEAAARSMDATAPSLRLDVLMAIQAAGNRGLTDDEIEVKLGLRHQTASARRRELVQAGLVLDSRQRRPTRSGRQASVWIATR